MFCQEWTLPLNALCMFLESYIMTVPLDDQAVFSEINVLIRTSKYTNNSNASNWSTELLLSWQGWAKGKEREMFRSSSCDIWKQMCSPCPMCTDRPVFLYMEQACPMAALLSSYLASLMRMLYILGYFPPFSVWMLTGTALERSSSSHTALLCHSSGPVSWILGMEF